MRDSNKGFTLLELMIATGVFLLISAAMFELLQLSQRSYGNESQISSSFQEARLALDQLASDFDHSGYPPVILYTQPPDPSLYAVGPTAWSPGYALTPCTLGVTCLTPGDFDLILEESLNIPTNLGIPNTQVNWIRYQLVGNTLYRAAVPKVAGADPVAATSAQGVMVPFLTNVMNNPGAQMPQITASYPAMFPGGIPVPIFRYSCDSPTGTVACSLAGSSNSPLNVRDVDITLIVSTIQPDLQTQQIRLVQLTGRGHRLNPTN